MIYEVTFIKDMDNLTTCMPVSHSLSNFKMNGGLTFHTSECHTVNFNLKCEMYLDTLFESKGVCTIKDSVIRTLSKVIHLSVFLFSDLD